MKFNFILYNYYRFHVEVLKYQKYFVLNHYIRLEHMKFNFPETFELDLN